MINVCALFLVSFGWFAAHAVPSLYFGDNGELLAAIHTGGIPHPTGFPLFLLLSTLPAQAGTFAVNLVSSACGALAVVLVFLTARRLFGRIVGYSSAVILLGSCTLTLQAAMARVYPLQLAALAAVMLAAAVFKPEKSWGLLFGFVLGLSAGTHTLFLGGLVFAAVLLYGRKREALPLGPWVLGGFILGSSVFLWIPIRAYQHPGLSWGDPSNAGNFWAYLVQRNYGYKFFARDGIGVGLFLRQWADVWGREWNPLIWFLALGGLTFLGKARRAETRALGALAAFNVALLFVYGDGSDLAILYRYFLPAYAAAAVLAGMASSELWNRWVAPFYPRLPGITLPLILAAWCVPFPALRWSTLSVSSSCDRYTLQMFRYLPKNAIAVLEGDNKVFPAAYGRFVLDLRPDLRFHEWAGTLFPDAFRRVRDSGGFLTRDRLEGDWYREQGGCLFVSNQRREDAPFLCRPWGLFYRLADTKSEKSLPAPPKPYGLTPDPSPSEFRDPEAMESLSDAYLMAAAGGIDQGDRSFAMSNLEAAVTANPDTLFTLINASSLYERMGLEKEADALLLHALEVQPRNFEATLNLGIHCGKRGDLNDAWKYLKQAQDIRPGDPSVQFYLSAVEESQGSRR